jgi:peptidoglycan/LPS O-acetylase OafA/YrhL
LSWFTDTPEHWGAACPIAAFMGARSYSIYLAHAPVIGLTLFVLTSITDWQSQFAVFATLICIVPILTLGLSCVLYELVEKLGIALGRRIKMQQVFPAQSPVHRSRRPSVSI